MEYIDEMGITVLVVVVYVVQMIFLDLNFG